MSWTCICIVAPLRESLLMKTGSSRQIDGVLIPPGDRSSGKSSINGTGPSACIWEGTWLHLLSAGPNLLLPRKSPPLHLLRRKFPPLHLLRRKFPPLHLPRRKPPPLHLPRRKPPPLHQPL